jgi:hypothetical protein
MAGVYGRAVTSGRGFAGRWIRQWPRPNPAPVPVANELPMKTRRDRALVGALPENAPIRSRPAIRIRDDLAPGQATIAIRMQETPVEAQTVCLLIQPRLVRPRPRCGRLAPRDGRVVELHVSVALPRLAESKPSALAGGSAPSILADSFISDFLPVAQPQTGITSGMGIEYRCCRYRRIGGAEISVIENLPK